MPRASLEYGLHPFSILAQGTGLCLIVIQLHLACEGGLRGAPNANISWLGLSWLTNRAIQWYKPNKWLSCRRLHTAVNPCSASESDTLAWYTDTPEYSDQRDRGYTIHPVPDPAAFKAAAEGQGHGTYFLDSALLPNEGLLTVSTGTWPEHTLLDKHVLADTAEI